jgi:hypothetical protein
VDIPEDRALLMALMVEEVTAEAAVIDARAPSNMAVLPDAAASTSLQFRLGSPRRKPPR